LILVTGGAGYIGSHVAKELLKSNYTISVIDNLSTGHQAALPDKVPFFNVDLLDAVALKKVFEELKPSAVMHFAAKSIVSDSITNPLGTFYPNLVGTMNLLDAMKKYSTNKMVFSSTAAVYGEPEKVPIDENHPQKPTNPYGESKLFIEKIFSRLANVGDLQYISLRYFNAAGADPEGDLGEDHSPETHLIPLVLATAGGQKEKLMVFGDDYPTEDGTPIRDYIHITDLVSAHILSLEALLNGNKTEAVYNLGNERGYSVMEIIKKAEEITDKNISYEIGPRREGDPSVLIASSNQIKQELNWDPRHSDLDYIIKSAWQWHQKNPAGYTN